MGFSKFLKTTLLLAIIVGLIGCSATPTRRSFKEGWKDSLISAKVKYNMIKDKSVKKRNIDVDAWRGVVTLTGRVTSVTEKERAEQLSWQVQGVRGVDNFLKLIDDAPEKASNKVAERDFTEEDLVNVVGTAKSKVPTNNRIADKKVIPTPVKKTEVQPTPVKKVVEPQVVNNLPKPPTAKPLVDDNSVDMSAKRSEYSKPMTSQIQEKDLTSEDGLAREAAEELRKLRGEEGAE